MRSADTLIFMRITSDVATCMDYTGLDPFSGEEVYTARNLRDRKLQRALLPFFKPENDFAVREALQKAGYSDLIGSGCNALIPAQPPKAALRPRMEEAGRALAEGRSVHTIAPKPETPTDASPPRSKPAGYRPGRKTARRRRRSGD
jgi:hypothetical protein